MECGNKRELLIKCAELEHSASYSPRSSTTVAATVTNGDQALLRRSVTKMDWLSTAQLTLQLSEEERRRAACLGKLRYLQARLCAFEQRQQESQHSASTSAQPPETPSSQTSRAQQLPQPELLRSTSGMRLTPSTHLLAQQERDRDIQQRRRRAGRQLPSAMSGAPLLGRSLQGAEKAANSPDEAQQQPAAQPPVESSVLLPAPQFLPPPPPPPPASTPHPPPLPDSVIRSAGFYKLGFGPGERGAAAKPLDGRLDGQRARLQRQRHRKSGGDGSASYLDGQARRFLRVTAPSGQQQQQQQQQQPLQLPADSIAVRVAMRDYERTFLQPRNPVNSPEPDAYM